MSFCQECSRAMVVVDTEMLRSWITATGVVAERWDGRLEGATTRACPACDSYALGVELVLGAPFYSGEVAAFLTVHDRDWWNPAEVDIRSWPDFGCVTFSEAAMDSAVAYLREFTPELLTQDDSLAFEPGLAGSAGIPDEQPEQEWINQLGILHSRLEGKYSQRELDLAVRALLRALS